MHADIAATDRTDPAAPFTVGYAGHLYPWKGVDLLIEALARCRTRAG